MMRPGVRFVVVLAAVGSVAGCSDADGDGASGLRDDYVAAFADVAASGPTASDDESRCIADATVDTLGVDTLRDAVTPEEVRQRRSTRPADLGIEVDESDGDAFHSRLQDCMDVRQFLVEATTPGDDLVSDDVQSCVAEAFDEELVRRIAIDSFVNPSNSPDPDVRDAVETVFRDCSGG